MSLKKEKLLCVGIVFIAIFAGNLIEAKNKGSKTMALPPDYLKELNIDIKDVSKEETDKTLVQLKTGTLIALRSLKNGGYVYADCTQNKKFLRTMKSEGSAKFLTFTSSTPQETQFYVIQNPDISGIIWLKSAFLEGKCLGCTKTGIVFKDFDSTDESLQWEVESADGLKQIYLKNKELQSYLCVEDARQQEKNVDNEMSCSEKSRYGLFKIAILNN